MSFNIERENQKLRYRKTNDEPVGNVVLRMLKAYGIQDKYFEARAKQLWHETMGPTISGYTQNIYVKNRKLYISISSSSLRQEISYSKDKIRKFINEGIGHEFITAVMIW
ncbi:MULTISPECIES: DciA family protein [unclassified Aureispira]|uniref:DciA family protein n=1 Tax=unclassified Aureispira TaxID=2649989 RepID=UPI0006983FD0|nr:MULTISPECIES: DciA family protein [unclassified Aureispira]WMX13857.1 DciA family protein [Aureispira sp. CCB-E]